MKLIITEKPIAAKRIADILGKPKKVIKNKVECYFLDDSIIVPMKGHVLNVDFPHEYKSWEKTELQMLIDADLRYDPVQESIVKTIAYFAPKCDQVIISCDYDREGESIGREAVEIIKKKNKKFELKRAKFSTLTNTDVKDAFSNLADFDFNLADSADTRREIDLIWGAVLTRFISLASHRLGRAFLSVGRVQTPTLALIVEREKEIKAFKPEPFWVVYIVCDKKGEKFTAHYETEKLFDKKKADTISALKSDKAAVVKVEKREIHHKPPSPFNTTEFLRAASYVGFQPRAALYTAEKLYMSGYVSYPRTDNTVYSKAIKLRKILEKFEKSPDFGKLAKKLLALKELKPTKGKKFATDHPPIHPVTVADKKKLPKKEWKIYELIVRRFFATLAPNSVIESMRVDLDYSGQNFVTHGKRNISLGWKEYYPYSKAEEVILPKLVEGEAVSVDDIKCDEEKTKPKPRYTPAALIKKMDENDLGTKSTRAEMLHKLTNRGYIEGRQHFEPSHVGFAVIDVLSKYSPDITKPDMTADLEKEMDLVELGKKKKKVVVEKSRKMLHKVTTKLQTHKKEIGDEIREAAREDLILGECPECGGNLIIIRTRKGTRFVGCSNYRKGCRESFPLPAKGKIIDLNKKCEVCGLPMIRVYRFQKRPFDMCINHKCKSKADWGKKKVRKDEKK